MRFLPHSWIAAALAPAALFLASSLPVDAQTPPLPAGYAYAIRDVSLTGAGYEYSSSGQLHRGGNLVDIAPNGWVHGNSTRFSSLGEYLGTDSWGFNGTTTTRSNPVGTGYEYTLPSGATYRDASVAHVAGPISSFSFVRGTRFDTAGNYAGYDAWRFDGTTTRIVSLTGASYEFALPDTTLYRVGESDAVNATGQVIGQSTRFITGLEAGTDVWFFDGATTRVINPTGGAYEWINTGVVTRSGSAVGLNAAGKATGMSQRQVPLATERVSWFFDGTTTRVINLTGAPWTDPVAGEHSECNPPNALGHVIGLSDRYGSVPSGNQDAWFFDGTTTRRVNLTGAEYEYTTAQGQVYRSGQAYDLDDLDHIGGNSRRVSSVGDPLGVDCWVSDGTTTTAVGLTGAGYEYAAAGGNYRYCSSVTVDAAGRDLGSADRYASSGVGLGTDAWLRDGAGYHALSLTGAPYEFTVTGAGNYRESTPGYTTAGGKVYGANSRFDPTGGYLGQDSWYWNGTTVVRIGLTGGAYEYAATGGQFRSSASVGIAPNAAGQIVGVNYRYGSSGEDRGLGGWFYDPATGVTSELVFSVGTDSSAFTSPLVLTDAGAVLGSYAVYSGTAVVDNRAFWWDVASGFHDMGALISGGLAATGWASLHLSGPFVAGVGAGGAPSFIAAVGTLTSESTDSSDVALLTLTALPTGPVVSIAKVSGTTARLSWPANTGATPRYDVTWGSLNTLRSSAGNFTTSTSGCLGNDLVPTTVDDPAAVGVGSGVWYVVRVSNAGVPSTYDDGSPKQVGSRDAEIAASGLACP